MARFSPNFLGKNGPQELKLIRYFAAEAAGINSKSWLLQFLIAFAAYAGAVAFTKSMLVALTGGIGLLGLTIAIVGAELWHRLVLMSDLLVNVSDYTQVALSDLSER